MFTKRFCCSNEASTVAKMLAVTDIVLSILMLFVLSSFVHININYPQTLQKMTEENPEKQEDLKKFLTWGIEKKILMLSVPFTGSFLNGVKGILLFIGASQRSVRMMKIWLILTFIFLVGSLLSFVPEVIFTQDKGVIVVLYILDCLYEAYSIWVAKCLFFQLRIEAASQNISQGTIRTSFSSTSYRNGQNGEGDLTAATESVEDEKC